MRLAILLSLAAGSATAPAFMMRSAFNSRSPLTNCADITDCNSCINKDNGYTYECFWCPSDPSGSRCHAYGSPSTQCDPPHLPVCDGRLKVGFRCRCLGTDCISKSHVSICSSSTCPSPSPPAPPAGEMKVVVENKSDLHLKVIEITDTRSHQRGAKLCDLQTASSCTVGKDFIVISGDNAGDPFDVWWGDASWDKAHESIAVFPASKGYLKYEKSERKPFVSHRASPMK